MPNFEWLNDIPQSDWGSQNSGFCKSFNLAWFLQKSDVGVEAWAHLFDLWGAEQEREYHQFPCPLDSTGAPLAFIVYGDWDKTAAD